MLPGLRAQALLQQRLALLGALAARALGAAEELGEIVVAVALGVLDVLLEPERVAEALLGEPDDVVVLVLGAGDLTGLGGGCRLHGSPFVSGSRPRLPVFSRFTPAKAGPPRGLRAPRRRRRSGSRGRGSPRSAPRNSSRAGSRGGCSGGCRAS